jgi:hypothetical protein
MKRILLIVSSAIFIAAIAFFSVHAQLGTADLSITLNPSDPKPLQTVQVRVQSFGFDLNHASVTWTYNGITVASGTGRTSISVTAPANGKVGILAVTATSTDFAESSATLVLRPASVDLLWEGADSYTPPFYKGRALPSNNGIIRVTAIPNITAPRELSYDWQQSDSALPDSSGYGKNSLLFKNSTLNTTENISVTASNSSFSGTSSIAITPKTPTVVGYFNNDGYVDYANGSTTTLSTTGNGSIIRFEPYFFSTPYSIDHDLSFSYLDTDGNNLQTGSGQNELRLSRPDGGGESQFTVAINTIAYSLQNITRHFSMIFN